jgi:hypothetical protein
MKRLFSWQERQRGPHIGERDLIEHWVPHQLRVCYIAKFLDFSRHIGEDLKRMDGILMQFELLQIYYCCKHFLATKGEVTQKRHHKQN